MGKIAELLKRVEEFEKFKLFTSVYDGKTPLQVLNERDKVENDTYHNCYIATKYPFCLDLNLANFREPL